MNDDKRRSVRGAAQERREQAGSALALTDVESRLRRGVGWFGKITPTHQSPEQFVALVINELRKDDKLARAAMLNPASLNGAMNECARQGLIPGEEFHFVAFDTKTGPEIVGIRGWKGEVQLIYRSGSVSTVHAYVVRQGGAKSDEFAWQPGMTKPHHLIADDGLATDAERGQLTAVYAYCDMRGGGQSRVSLLRRDHVAKIRAVAKTKAFWGPEWPEEGQWTEDMWLKTALHHQYDLVPHSAEFLTEMLRAAATASGPMPAELGPAVVVPELEAPIDFNPVPRSLARGTVIESSKTTPGGQTAGGSGEPSPDDPISKAQATRVRTMLTKCKTPPEQIASVLGQLLGHPVEAAETLTRAEFDELVEPLKAASSAGKPDEALASLMHEREEARNP